MKISITNHDSTASLKVETYDSNSDMKASLETTLIMANQGSEAKEFNLAHGRAILLTASPDMTLEGNNVVINPDSQQNMVVSMPVGSNASTGIANTDTVAIPPTPASLATDSLNQPKVEATTLPPVQVDMPKPLPLPMSDAATLPPQGTST